MTLIDHLLTFPNENAAFGVLQSLGYTSKDEDDNIVWDRSRVDPGVKLITADAVWDNSDPENPILVSPQETIAGFHITISLPEADDVLEALPQKFLRVLENRGIATKSKKFHEYAEDFKSLPEGIASDTLAEHVNRGVGGQIDNLNFRISPRFLGSDYPDPL